jgi:hypothetical protein
MDRYHHLPPFLVSYETSVVVITFYQRSDNSQFESRSYPETRPVQIPRQFIQRSW